MERSALHGKTAADGGHPKNIFLKKRKNQKGEMPMKRFAKELLQNKLDLVLC
jgi:hypothetical protein